MLGSGFSATNLKVGCAERNKSDASLFDFRSSQMLCPRTIIGWLVFSMSSIAKRLRSFNAISTLTASMSSSDISSASANLWRCVDVRRENRLLICWAVLYSSGRKVGRPSSFVRIFISLATCKGNARISLVSSSCPPLWTSILGMPWLSQTS